jgi:Sensors of blue-light using FAD
MAGRSLLDIQEIEMASLNGEAANLGSMLYVSRSRLIYPEDNDQLANIQSFSVVRNRDLDVTGLLIVTPVFFAQYIEGEPDALRELMASIREDPRHGNLVMLDVPFFDYRRFPSWRMSMFGPDERISQITHPVLTHMNGALPPEQMNEVLAIIENFSLEEAHRRLD